MFEVSLFLLFLCLKQVHLLITLVDGTIHYSPLQYMDGTSKPDVVAECRKKVQNVLSTIIIVLSIFDHYKECP